MSNTLSRTQLAEVILRQGSVIIPATMPGGSRIVTKLEDLPSEVELAGDDIVRKQQAVGDLDAEIAKLLRLKEQAEQALNVTPETEVKTPEDGKEPGQEAAKEPAANPARN